MTFAVKCAEKLRAQNSCCQRLMIFLHTNPHKKEQPQAARNIVLQLPYATNSNIELAEFAASGLDKIFCDGFRYKRAGVVALDLVPMRRVQLDMFSNSDARHAPLMQAVDCLNARFGKARIKLASQDLRHTWKMRQEALSARYTTRLSDVITVRSG